MLHALSLGIILLLCLLPPGNPVLEIQMEFLNESVLRVMVEATSNLTLHWPIRKQEILGLDEIVPGGTWDATAGSLDVELISTSGSGVKTGFNVYFPVKEGEEHSFPVPTCDSQLEIGSFQVLLPGGWTTDSEDVIKRLYPGDTRVMLIWEDPGDSPKARLLRPGSRAGLWARTLLVWIPAMLVLTGLLVPFILLRKLVHRGTTPTHVWQTKEL